MRTEYFLARVYASRHAAIPRHNKENTFRKHRLACVNSCGTQKEPLQDQPDDASNVICLQWTQKNPRKQIVVRRVHFSTQPLLQTHDRSTGHTWQHEDRRKTLCLEHSERTLHQNLKKTEKHHQETTFGRKRNA